LTGEKAKIRKSVKPRSKGREKKGAKKSVARGKKKVLGKRR